MADISSITLPNGQTYNLKDTVARNSSGTPLNYDVETPSFSSLPQTFHSPYFTAQHKVVGNALLLSNPKAGDLDWDVTFSDGFCTITGTFHGNTATTVKMSIWVPTRTIIFIT